MKNQRLSNVLGMSLLEAVIAISITSIILLSITTMIEVINNNNLRQNLTAQRNELITSIRSQSSNLSNLDASAILTRNLGVDGLTPDIGVANNLIRYDMLARCSPSITDVNLGSCDLSQTDGPNGNRFYLVERNDPSVDAIIAGEDVFYNTQGQRCTQSEAVDPDQCPMFAKVWAEPFCLNFAANCNKAMSVTVHYAVGTRPDVTRANIKISTLEGQVYIPLQKGIQISRVLNQDNVAISANSSGIYPVLKYYGSEPVRGLRFEALIGNPIGLTKMHVEMRSLTGEEAANYGANTIPPELEVKPWVVVSRPGVNPETPPSGPWEITLGSAAQPNQIFNFGTMTTAAGASGTSVSYWIGSGTTSNNTYNWVHSIGNQPTPPSFKSGFYQFRVVATDSQGGQIQSTNYVTVRIISKPRIFQDFPSSSLAQFRNCVSSTVNYNFHVVDDEKLSSQEFFINGSSQGVDQLNNVVSTQPYTFNRSQPPGTYSLSLNATNRFTGTSVAGITIQPITSSATVSLSNQPTTFNTMTSIPTKIRINNSGTVSTTYTAGNCCNQDPTFTWSYPIANNVGQVMLQQATAPLTECSVSGDFKVCNSSVTVNGIYAHDNPTGRNIQATLGLSDYNDLACKSPQTADNFGIAIPVITIPSVYFYTEGSLWLNLPANTNSNFNRVRAPNRRVAVRIDFDPSTSVSVKLAKNGNPADSICTLTFPAGPKLSPTDLFCTIPDDYNGTLQLIRESANLRIDTDQDGPSYHAKIDSARSVHSVCSANLNAAGSPFTNRFFANSVRSYSPWGMTGAGQEWSQSDALVTDGSGNWGTKNLRCYDNWSLANYPTWGYSGLGTSGNEQDAYGVIKYNREDRLLPGNHDTYRNTLLKIGMRDYWFPEVNGATQYSADNNPHLFVVMQEGGVPAPIPFTSISTINNQMTYATSQNLEMSHF